MRILVDTLSCGPLVYGVGTFLREHLRNLSAAGQQGGIVVSPDTWDLYRDVAGSLEPVFFPWRLSGASRSLSLPAQLAWEGLTLRGRAADLGIEVFWRPNLSFSQPMGCAQVATIHDLAEYHPEGRKQYSAARIAYRRLALRSAVAASNRIVTVSQFSREALSRLFPRRAGDIRVVANGGPAAGTSPSGPARWYLSVGRMHRHKNLDMLCRAYIRRDRQSPLDLPLVLLGGEGNAAQGLKELVAREEYGKKILFKGYVSEPEKTEYLKAARACFLPSLYEGFGIPVLEAMAHGVPVIASHAASLPEVAGDAALLLDPRDEAAWTDAFRSIQEGSLDLREMAKAGFRNVARYSWKCATDSLLEALYEASAGTARFKPNRTGGVRT